MELEKGGVPTAIMCTQGFDVLGRRQAIGRGVPALPLVTIPEYFGMSNDELRGWADRVVGDIVEALSKPRQLLMEKAARHINQNGLASGAAQARELQNVSVEPDAASATDAFRERGWTDGLPILPPTREAVDRMLTHADRAPDEVIAKVATRWGKATVEKIAVNAVMAGCRPEYMPVLIAAVRAITDPAFNLTAVQATTNPVAPLLIVNGPVAQAIGMNSRFNAFGQGSQANATIGRALRLVMINVGGGHPEATDRAIQGQPAKYTFCVAENEAESPWDPLHVERGLERGASAVTAVAVMGFHAWASAVHTLETGSAESLVSTMSGAMAAMGVNNVQYAGVTLLVLNPYHASILARSGYSKDRLKQELFERGRIPVSRYHPLEITKLRKMRPTINWDDPRTMIPMTDRWEDIMVTVIGAGGVHGIVLPSYGRPSTPVTRAVAVRSARARSSGT